MLPNKNGAEFRAVFYWTDGGRHFQKPSWKRYDVPSGCSPPSGTGCILPGRCRRNRRPWYCASAQCPALRICVSEPGRIPWRHFHVPHLDQRRARRLGAARGHPAPGLGPHPARCEGLLVHRAQRRLLPARHPGDRERHATGLCADREGHDRRRARGPRPARRLPGPGAEVGGHRGVHHGRRSG